MCNNSYQGQLNDLTSPHLPPPPTDKIKAIYTNKRPLRSTGVDTLEMSQSHKWEVHRCRRHDNYDAAPFMPACAKLRLLRRAGPADSSATTASASSGAATGAASLGVGGDEVAPAEPSASAYSASSASVPSAAPASVAVRSDPPALPACARAYATAASTAVAKEPMVTVLPATLCCARKRP